MAGAVCSYAKTFGGHLYGTAFGYPDPFEIDATPQNLKVAIREKGKDVLKCKFKDPFHRDYTALEYAVKIGGKDSVCTLIALGAKVDYCSFTSLGTIVHFYIDCIKKDTPPDLEMLNLLLQDLTNVNEEEAGYFCTPLEYALHHMKHYENIHWDVIEILLQKGCRITDAGNGVSPFMILKDSDNHKIRYEQMLRTPDEEKRFLDHLVKYLTLERKYHPKSTSALTLKEFKYHTSFFIDQFSRVAVSMSISDFVLSGFESLSEYLEQLSNPEALFKKHPLKSQTLESWDQKDLAKFLEQCKAVIHRNRRNKIKAEMDSCVLLGKLFRDYHKLFQTLVKKGDFSECFDLRQLASIMPIVDKISHHSAQAKALLFLLDIWGLVDKATPSSLDNMSEPVEESKALEPREEAFAATMADEIWNNMEKLQKQNRV